MSGRRWTFRRSGAQRWELVLADLHDYRKVIYTPGYESSNPGDIIAAMLYLNCGYRGTLPERSMQLLDSIQRCIS